MGVKRSFGGIWLWSHGSGFGKKGNDDPKNGPKMAIRLASELPEKSRWGKHLMISLFFQEEPAATIFEAKSRPNKIPRKSGTFGRKSRGRWRLLGKSQERFG